MTMNKNPHLEFGSFWIRAAAMVIDLTLIMVVTMPALLTIYGTDYLTQDDLIHGFWDFVIMWIFPMVATIAFWIHRGATPGKLVVQLEVVDRATGKRPTRNQAIKRYLSYFLSGIPLGFGYIWVALDPKRRAWHDILADTVVIRRLPAYPNRFVEPVQFEGFDQEHEA